MSRPIAAIWLFTPGFAFDAALGQVVLFGGGGGDQAAPISQTLDLGRPHLDPPHLEALCERLGGDFGPVLLAYHTPYMVES